VSEPVQLAGSVGGAMRLQEGREVQASAWRELAPTVVLGGGLALGVALLAAAIVVRLRVRRSAARAGHAEQRALGVVARAMRLSRGVRAGVERLALAAEVREPAVLVMSEFAFREAAARAVGRVPESAEAIAQLGRELAFDAKLTRAK